MAFKDALLQLSSYPEPTSAASVGLRVGGAFIDMNRDHADRSDLAGLRDVEPVGSARDRIAVVANEPAGPRRNIGVGRRDQRVEVHPAWLEAPETAVGKACLEAANERTDAALRKFVSDPSIHSPFDAEVQIRLRRPSLLANAIRRSRSVIAAAISNRLRR